MDRARILCEKDRDMLYEFQRRSLDRIGGQSLLLAALPFFSGYLDANVKKEADKDRLIIETAARAYAAGTPVCDLDLEDIFEQTKLRDKAFLRDSPIPSSLLIRYSEFADIRIQRIGRISTTVYTLLPNWPDAATFSDAVRNAYTGNAFQEIITEILRLYNRETRMLSKSIRLFPPFNKAVNSYGETLFQAMEEATEEIAAFYTGKIFGEKKVHA